MQRTLVEAWGLIRETFIDPTFNHQGFIKYCTMLLISYFPVIITCFKILNYTYCYMYLFCDVDWDSKLEQTMVEMFPLKSADAAYGKISGMLASLGDPFTRIISPKVTPTSNITNMDPSCMVPGVLQLRFENKIWMKKT